MNNPELKPPPKPPPPRAFALKDLVELANAAKDLKIQILKLPWIEMVFHPSAFIELPKELQPKPAVPSIAKQKSPEAIAQEEEELLFHSA